MSAYVKVSGWVCCVVKPVERWVGGAGVAGSTVQGLMQDGDGVSTGPTCDRKRCVRHTAMLQDGAGGGWWMWGGGQRCVAPDNVVGLQITLQGPEQRHTHIPGDEKKCVAQEVFEGWIHC